MNWLDILSPSTERINEHANVEALENFEQELGCKLPTDYRGYLLTCSGGEITVDHELEPTICGKVEEYVRVFNLNGLSEVIESRAFRYGDKVGIERAIEIGDDCGTGFFFLMLSQRFFGQIYFCWKDVLEPQSPDWLAGVETMPDYMGLVATSFTNLGERILASSIHLKNNPRPEE